MIKKKSINELKNRIKTIVKEEVNLALKEEINPQFKKIRNKKAFSAWVMRQFFNPVKHSNKVWFDPSVNENNVLEKISEMSEEGIFPATPKSLSATWKLKSQLNASLGAMSQEEKEDLGLTAKKLKKEPVYKTRGDYSLRDIGKIIGVSSTMINKIDNKAIEDFKAITGGKHPDALSTEEGEELKEKINNAREEAADDFVDTLHSSSSVEDFLETLRKRKVLSPVDLKLVGYQERDGLEILAGKDLERAKMILLQDIEEDDNLFKSFQGMVYRKIFPAGKAGRPRK